MFSNINWRMPHTYGILFFMMVLAAIASYLIPAGEFQREEVDGRTIVVSGSYQETESSPVGFFDLFTAIPKGLSDSAEIVFYVFLVGGAFGIIQATGAIEAGIGRVAGGLANKEKLLIPVIMFIFSVLGTTMALSEEAIIFVPIGIAVARALGFDSITGTAMVFLGAAAGFVGGMFNPFTVGVAQSLAELPLFSGLAFRLVVYVVFLVFAIWYVMRYAMKVKRNPAESLVHDLEQKVVQAEFLEFNWRHAVIFIAITAGLAFNIYGIFKWGWFLTELAASFLIIGLLSGLIGKLGFNRSFEAFVEGMKNIAFGAIIVGFARAILVIMEQGQVIDTVIYGLTNVISMLPDELNVIGMLVVQMFISVVIPSGSGQAATTMPIMVPLTDILGIDRQVAVLAFQYGDGIMNTFVPTSASVMGVLAIAGIPFERWVKFTWKLVVAWTIIAIVALIIAVAL